ncbi:pyrroloquinoline quinone biosynthesis peptide chaperone PqqD [Phyllobacterium sp. 21LDTY02-6]|uniref:pyrroloquinoline quinone biosynthesis peptide chaperone PqqD n=1 Tax=unclassified Phyllobacterium TaxID=2638441 RepID=UPI002021B802|nr:MULTISPECIES: pyrroloquinoline quinone biosynthesis peptide chaperone PqqD [unclassified Phyllobacterium]MCO4318188.1 pyrroloquinoline quinone biosynthesis peptide chaperone PqqD [Phyllobacterium sp. 21LDTY02-6]MCX8280183.1 pyrroloquinoline quinone biosynthesis peptide chaperone PqqD [Phyllobacterium sp. 0TCS1.6C]MCX8294256.1 pyrroloquinoline quinone biosynthesis peptide chaperone PqqD [Phyllobacterium sp. 0TCS1.6A]
MTGTARARAIVTSRSRPRLRPHVRLQYDNIRAAWALLSPEKVFWPNEVSLDILRLCDGHRDVGEMIAVLAEQYAAEADEIAPDVTGFLQEWSDKFLVSL